MFIQTLHSLQLAGRYIGDFGIFLVVSLKAHACFDRPEYRMIAIYNFKTVKYCILSEVCMIKTAPRSNVSPQTVRRDVQKV